MQPEPLSPDDLVAACSSDKFVVSMVERGIRCANVLVPFGRFQITACEP